MQNSTANIKDLDYDFNGVFGASFRKVEELQHEADDACDFLRNAYKKVDNLFTGMVFQRAETAAGTTVITGRADSAGLIYNLGACEKLTEAEYTEKAMDAVQAIQDYIEAMEEAASNLSTIRFDLAAQVFTIASAIEDYGVFDD